MKRLLLNIQSLSTQRRLNIVSKNSNPQFERVLAIETSCDDTSIAVVDKSGYVISLSSVDQDEAHRPFGGVVPEVASRNHTLQLLPLVESCLRVSHLSWDDIDGIAVTSRPGLVGSLIVGVVSAKSLALAFDKPFVGVNHLEGHLLAPFLRDDQFSPPDDFQFPYIALAVSGGHSQLYLVKEHGRYEVLGRTIDDAAGEAFDKFAKVLGLGFPGGIKIDQLSKSGDPNKYQLPRALIHEKNFNFSFSGLKTAGHNLVKKFSEEDLKVELENICASYQEAIVDALMAKLKRAVKEMGISRAIITGGVSANSRLRSVAEEWANSEGVQLVVPPIRYCTDNAAMIGLAGVLKMNRGEVSDHGLAPSPRSYAGDFIQGESR